MSFEALNSLFEVNKEVEEKEKSDAVKLRRKADREKLKKQRSIKKKTS